jgi:hypothetical protein
MPNWTEKSDAERVARGAALLDQEMPTWFLQIDTDRLTFFNEVDCILGQLYGSLAAGLTKLHLSISELQEQNFYDHGLNGNAIKLKGLWLAEIESRKLAGICVE